MRRGIGNFRSLDENQLLGLLLLPILHGTYQVLYRIGSFFFHQKKVLLA